MQQPTDPVNAAVPGSVLSTVMSRGQALPVGQRFTMISFPAAEGTQPLTNHHVNDYGPWIVQRIEDIDGQPDRVKVYIMFAPLPSA